MNAVDASVHVEVETAEETPSLCTVVLDTNPRAWAAIGDTLPLSKAVANILVFLNANLAFSNANQVAVIAAHTNRAVWLYPTQPEPSSRAGKVLPGDDVPMHDSFGASHTTSANKYPQFAQIESAVLASLKSLIESTTETDLDTTTTQLSGALTLALAHINKISQAYTASKADTTKSHAPCPSGLSASILVVSVSDAEPSQYIPTMNAVFAAAHSSIPIDVLSLSPASIAQAAPGAAPAAPLDAPPDVKDQPATNSFLQQASHITNGVYLQPAHPQGLLSYLFFAYAFADNGARAALIPPTHHTVDFRAACFCHGRVIDTGFVCSVCLSIFCSVPEGADCLTCGTHLALGSYGAKPAVVPRRKKKRKRVLPNGSIREDTGTPGGGTPMR
ncbi:RNA polymerase II transcription factor B subunit 4 [Plectosphaerella cucumerina]|uniref:General transcription and DNA repair factor IIH subunit TFB4 n=1 Tax=Plectosphaerella cucumerina TaxID=40658 RepID=A0A8K0WZW5_9PEZI|nr:RNA polymerase II transcription factor B subunit 4 [Plectosphaerella cucumerina]